AAARPRGAGAEAQEGRAVAAGRDDEGREAPEEQGEGRTVRKAGQHSPRIDPPRRASSILADALSHAPHGARPSRTERRLLTAGAPRRAREQPPRREPPVGLALGEAQAPRRGLPRAVGDPGGRGPG